MLHGQEAVSRLPLKEYMFTNTMLISQDFVFVLSKNYTSLFLQYGFATE